MRENLDSLIAAARMDVAEPVSRIIIDLAAERGVDIAEIHAARTASACRLAELPLSGGWFAFEDAEVLPPGLFDPRVVNQSEIWYDALRRSWRIEAGHETSLTDEHLVNIVGWLPHSGLLGLDRRPIDSRRLVAVMRTEAESRGLVIPDCSLIETDPDEGAQL